MSRSGLTDDGENQWHDAMWRGRVANSIRGRRGQSMLRDLLAALDAMPGKALIAKELVADGQVCAIGSLGMARGMAMETMDVEDYDAIAKAFDVAAPLVQEIEWANDEGASVFKETPEQRWTRMREWVARRVTAPGPKGPGFSSGGFRRPEYFAVHGLLRS